MAWELSLQYCFDQEALLAWRHDRLTFGETTKVIRVGKATLHLLGGAGQAHTTPTGAEI